MKSNLFIFLLSAILVFASCKKDNDSVLGGDQSPMGEIGVTVGSTSAVVAGVSGVAGTVVSLENGISSFTGTAVITNSTIKNILANHPLTTINGNNVTVSGVELKITSEGIESITGLAPGIIVKYDAQVGDTYAGNRTVTSRSTDDDYPYGFMLIKAIKVEENTNKFGVKKTIYWANHRFGLVGIEFTFDDNSTAKFPVYTSAENL
jgi:hypothetical protein